MILNSPYISGSLTVTGNIIASGSITLSGSVASASYAASASNALAAQTASYVLTAQTASFVANAQSASNAVAAQTASYANAFTVGSTLTAQTLVVQTITSSVDFVTGSTRFGSSGSNTHVFTGSVYITGSISVTGSAAFSSDVILPYSKALAFNSISNQYVTADANNLYLGTGNLARLTISSSGAATFSAATSATTLTTNGTAGQWSIRVNGSSVAGSSYGLGVYAGTNSSDDAFRVHSYSGTQYLTVRGDGYVGIGTTNPGQKLEVVGGEIKAGRVDSSNEGGQVSFGRASDNNTSWYIDVYGNTSTPSLRFVDVSNSSVRMSIDGSGNTTFSNRLISNGYKSYSGEISIASGATSTIYTMSDNGLYTAQVIVGGGSLIYSAAAIFYSHSNNGQFVKTMDLYDGSNVTLDQSSGAIRITNNGFTTLTWNWSIIFQPF